MNVQSQNLLLVKLLLFFCKKLRRLLLARFTVCQNMFQLYEENVMYNELYVQVHLEISIVLKFCTSFKIQLRCRDNRFIVDLSHFKHNQIQCSASGQQQKPRMSNSKDCSQLYTRTHTIAVYNLAKMHLEIVFVLKRYYCFDIPQSMLT